jgi:hypothetical protein
VATSFVCTDAVGGGGIVSCTDSHGGSGTSGTLDTSTAGPKTYTVTARSKDGLTGEKPITYTVDAVKTTCTGNAGTASYSPGLTNTPQEQTVKVKGTLSGCSGDGYTGGKYRATLKTVSGASCASLKSVSGEVASGTALITWLPKRRGDKATGTLSLPITEAPGAILSGEVETGPFPPAILAGAVSQTFTGAANCGATGKKGIKPIRKASFTGSAVQLY